MRKFLPVLMSIAMVAALVAGCGSAATSEPAEEEAVEEAAEEEEEAEAPAEEEAVEEEAEAEEPAAEAETPKEGIKWRFVSAFTKEAAEHAGFWKFYDRINEELDGRLNIEYLGGTEVVAYFDQFEQMGQGVFEVSHYPVNMIENIVPCTDALYLTELTPMEMRESGAFDFMHELYREQGNAEFLGVTGGNGYGYTFYTNFEVNSLDDFKGKTIRTAPVFVPMLEALGAGAVSIGSGEVYSALERGVVDGAGWSTIGAVDYAWYEVCKYRIDPIFYPCNVGIFVNKDAFDALPEDLQAEVRRIAQECEEESFEMYGEMVAEEFAALEEHGMQTITLEGEMRDQWLNMAHEAGWANLEKLDPENCAKIRPLVTKG